MASTKDVMTKRVITVGPKDKANDAMATLVSKKVSGMPVVDADGKVVGMLTEADLLVARANQNVASLMTTRVVTAPVTASLKSITDTLLKKKIKRVAIVDKNKKLLGVVSRRDILATKVK